MYRLLCFHWALLPAFYVNNCTKQVHNSGNESNAPAYLQWQDHDSTTSQPHWGDLETRFCSLFAHQGTHTCPWSCNKEVVESLSVALETTGPLMKIGLSRPCNI